MAEYNGKTGVWRTVGGRRIFIADGEDLASAMKRSGKFKDKKQESKKVEKKNSELTEDERKKKIEELEKKKEETQGIISKGAIQEEIDMVKDGYDDKEKYREYLSKEREKREKQYEKERTERQKQIREEKLRNAIKKASTQKALKELVDDDLAKDITRLSDEETRKLREKHGRLETVKVVHGVYGANGALLRSYETGEYFVITSRNTNLFYWV